MAGSVVVVGIHPLLGVIVGWVSLDFIQVEIRGTMALVAPGPFLQVPRDGSIAFAGKNLGCC